MYKTIRLVIVTQPNQLDIPQIARAFLDTLPQMKNYKGSIATDIVIVDDHTGPMGVATVKMTMVKKMFNKDEVFILVHNTFADSIESIATAMAQKFSKQPPVLKETGSFHRYELIEPDLEFFDSPIKNQQRNAGLH